jgi:hypothetical protein
MKGSPIDSNSHMGEFPKAIAKRVLKIRKNCISQWLLGILLCGY